MGKASDNVSTPHAKNAKHGTKNSLFRGGGRDEKTYAKAKRTKIQVTKGAKRKSNTTRVSAKGKRYGSTGLRHGGTIGEGSPSRGKDREAYKNGQKNSRKEK